MAFGGAFRGKGSLSAIAVLRPVPHGWVGGAGGDIFLAVPSAHGPGLGGRLARTPGQQNLREPRVLLLRNDTNPEVKCLCVLPSGIWGGLNAGYPGKIRERWHPREDLEKFVFHAESIWPPSFRRDVKAPFSSEMPFTRFHVSSTVPRH